MIFYRDGLEQTIDAPPTISKTREGHIVETYKVDGIKKYFVTLLGSFYCAHGNTLPEAITDALWKDESKRPSMESLRAEINAAGKARKISLQEFRLLTGACLEGCRVALKRAKLNGKPMLSKDIQKHFPIWGDKLFRVLEEG